MIKQSDIAMIILVISISLLASFFLGNAIINTPENRSSEVEVATEISADFPQPETSIFNDDSVNPTQLIQIGTGSSDQVFPTNQN